MLDRWLGSLTRSKPCRNQRPVLPHTLANSDSQSPIGNPLSLLITSAYSSVLPPPTDLHASLPFALCNDCTRVVCAEETFRVSLLLCFRWQTARQGKGKQAKHDAISRRPDLVPGAVCAVWMEPGTVSLNDKGAQDPQPQPLAFLSVQTSNTSIFPNLRCVRSSLLGAGKGRKGRAVRLRRAAPRPAGDGRCRRARLSTPPSCVHALPETR